MKRTHAQSTVALVIVLAARWGGVAEAQQPANTSTGVDVGRYRPMTPANRGFELESPRPLPHKAWAIALDFDYAADPLRVRATPGGEYQLLDHALSANLLAAVGLWGRVEAALALPVVLSQGGTAPPGVTAPATGGVGDARLTLKARLIGPEPRGFSLATSLTISAPVASRGLINDGGLGLEPRVIAEYQVRRWTVGARLGYRLRPSPDLLGNAIGDQLTFGLGGQVRIGRATRLIAEIDGATSANADVLKKRRTPVEAMLGVRRHGKHLFATAGAGLGLVSGFGTPSARAVLSLGWATTSPDSDRDGVEDVDDQCVDEPEDRDDFQDADGCPDPDNDEDGLADADDKCPNDPEDADEFEDEDGCPDPDNDGDAIADADDKCPNEAETKNDWEDEDGCPDEVPTTDEDKDGIADVDDACPKEAEDKDGFEDEDGCPDPDNDKDGVADAADKCPAEPETINGNKDDDGCPDEGAPQVKIGEKELETMQPVFFNTDRSRVRHRFHKLLNQIALTLNAHTEIGRCAVEGHTDSTGPAEWNQTLSLKRADAVVTYLVKRGVAPSRLLPIGQGAAMPWAENDSEDGRAKNRRVVFHIEGVDKSEKPKPARRRRSQSDEPTSTEERRAGGGSAEPVKTRDHAHGERAAANGAPSRAAVAGKSTEVVAPSLPPNAPATAKALPDGRRATTMNDGSHMPDRGSEELSGAAAEDEGPRRRVRLPSEKLKRPIGPAAEDELEGKSLRDLIKIPK